ncbi:MAG: DinB family protein [Coprothermobacterota bacterium]|nr:DinB family protein [Coprothermobacterota bacterium]
MERQLSSKEALLFLLEDTWGQVEVATKGMTSEEFYFKPVPKALGPDAALEEPMPQGVSTIGFKIAHMTLTVLDVVNSMKGEGEFNTQEFLKRAPKDFPGWMELLKESYNAFHQYLLDLPEEGLTSLRKVWGDEYPIWKMIIWIADHYSWHAGQIKTLRAHFEHKTKG